MTIRAESDQILFAVAPQVAPGLDGMDLQVPGVAQRIRSAAVTLQHLQPQLFIRLRLKADSSRCRDYRVHALSAKG